MELIRISDNPTELESRIKKTLTSGGVVALPTDTVYGLFSLPNEKAAIEKIYTLKMRPDSMPLPLLISGTEQLPYVSSFQNQILKTLVGAFWPGPLTVILPSPSPSMSLIASAENTIAVRCPNNDLVRRIANDLGPLAATSANIHGKETPETASEIADMLPNVDLIADGGPLKDGLASTLVDLTQPVPQILREGPITEKMIITSLE
ncbi:MAG: L-threonylcarbamoyladenylate synthase [Actinomycetota bacterium]|nr:L-threonylcarbamoyladenylate synthase [Actinomycetota bacterium]MED5264523.1 L-threonylcarbamoyladenylate synthase [Actinomycetota bacterium]|tara:strand:- start:2855 stop:3472 length:618 start_codon:yes stop_codon:yes gene_type:complete